METSNGMIEALIRIAEALEKGFVPFWFSAAVGIFVPIVLTGLSVWLNNKTSKQNAELQKNLHNQNAELQKNLHNRDVKNQTRQFIINIYNSYLDALSVAESANHNVETIFISLQSIQSWSTAVFNANTSVIRSFNQANIILNDYEMVAYLKKCTESFVVFSNVVGQYVNTPMPSQSIQNAWNKINQQTFGKYTQLLGIYDYNLLFQNQLDLEELKKMCANSHTKNIQEKLEIFLGLVKDEKFDNYFKKYVQIQDM